MAARKGSGTTAPRRLPQSQCHVAAFGHARVRFHFSAPQSVVGTKREVKGKRQGQNHGARGSIWKVALKRGDKNKITRLNALALALSLSKQKKTKPSGTPHAPITLLQNVFLIY